MWNYSFEFPTLSILAIILVFYFSRPRLPVRRNIVFIHMIVIETLIIILDILATMVDNDYAAYSIIHIKVLNMLYFVAFFDRAYIMYVFSISVLRDSLQEGKLFKKLIRLPLFAGVFISVISIFIGSADFPYVIFYINETGYHSGNLYNFLYVCEFFYVLLAFIAVVMFGRTLGRRRERYGILIYNLLIFAALIIRLTLPKYLIMDTLILIAILIVFLAFGNPDFHLDLRGTAFNRLALSKYLEENTGRLKLTPFGVVIRNYHEMRDLYESSQMEEGLVMIAKYLKRISPKGILFYCRKGRFIVLDQPGRNFREEAKTITERFDHPWKSHSTELYLSVSCATFDNITGNYSSEILLSTMLKALESIGRAETEEPLTVTEEDIKRTETERGVRQCIENALGNDGFELYLQPIVDAKTGRIIGAEALSRIRDTEGNIIPPGLFIPVAENSGRINRLGELVFDRTCKFIKENPIEKMGIEWINVNLSPLQFLCTDLDERFLSIINKYGIDPNSVHLEITEESMIDDRFLQKQIKAMGEKGFLFVLDDYGTGYSNLSRLKKCPFINVKLDMSIVWDYCREPDDILPNMILAFKNMGFSITAEGIEDENMINTMKSVGCDLLQGYYYSKPVPASDFPKII